MKRYEKNVGSMIDANIQKQLLNTTVAIIGVGGNGGYVADFVARLGVKTIIIFDGDTFEERNLNRQPFCTEENLHESKASETHERLQVINSDITYLIADTYLEEHPDWLKNERPDFIFWCADGYPEGDLVAARLAVRDCLLQGSTVIESCLFKDEAACMVITPDHVQWFDDRTEIWQKNVLDRSGETKWASQPAYLCAISAGLAVNELVKTIGLEHYPAFGQAIVYNACENKVHRIDSHYGQLY